MPCGCAETGVIYRWGTDGELERSNDGGDTWSGAPNQDPRNTSPLFPPPMGAMADKCPAADNAVNAIIVEVFNALTPEMTKDDADSLIRDWIHKYIDTSNPVLALITVIVNLIFGLIIDTLITALTTEVWDTLRCCFKNQMLDDFTFDHDAWEALRDCILTDIPGIAGIFLEHLIYLLGPAGSTNLIRSGQGSATAECGCPNCQSNWSIMGAGHGVIDDVTEEYVEAHGTDPGNGNYYLILHTTGASDCCRVDHVDVVSGAFTLNGWTDCGTAPTEGAPQHTGLGFGDCINYLQLQSATPFTVRVFFVFC